MIILLDGGGEEFIVLTQIKNIKQLETIAEHIRSAIENESFSPVLKVTASFGITLEEQKDTLESFVKRADEGLYKAKEQGRNQVVVNI
jgi:diguanylate cyclase (GGDEF)-like protein